MGGGGREREREKGPATDLVKVELFADDVAVGEALVGLLAFFFLPAK
jgi:hypothetical protein